MKFREACCRGIPPVIAMQKLDSIIYANRQIRRLEKGKLCPNQFQANSNPLHTGIHKIKGLNLLLKTTFKAFPGTNSYVINYNSWS